MEFSEKFKSKKEYLIITLAYSLIFLLIVLGISTLVGISNKIKEGQQIGQGQFITVSDSAERYVKPDLATISFSVVKESQTVAEAMDENSQSANKIIETVKDNGVEEKDIKTTAFNIYPRYEWQKDSTGFYPEGRRVLVGYEVRQTILVKIRDMAKIGEVIQGATDSGANEVGDLSFSVDQDEKIKEEVREEAIDKAKAKAKELAKQLGVRLKKITAFSEGTNTPTFYYDYAMEAAVAGKGGAVSSPQIETGENLIRISVSITYQIQ